MSRSAPVHPRARAKVWPARARRNLEALVHAARVVAPDLVGAVPMVKCNAYGHGLVAMADAVAASPVTVALGVATLEEAAALRGDARGAAARKPIWVFSDCAPWDSEVAALVERHALTPMIHRLEDLRRLARSRPSARLRAGFQLKFNTGMNRLGLDVSEASAARRICESAGLRPQGVCSHFAKGEDPDAAETRRQVAAFRQVAAELASLGASYIHCAATAATIEARRLGWGAFCNLIRPGIGIYGYGGRAARGLGLEPVLELEARVIAARALGRGDTVGYGCAYRAAGAQRQALLSIGYGDGLMRSLSNARLRIDGRLVRVLGRVSMDVTSLGLIARPGTWVKLLGEDVAQGEHMAGEAGTIIYETLTSISSRVPRVYL